MNLTHQVDPKEEEIPAPLTPGRVLDLGVTLNQIHHQTTTVTKQHLTMSPVTISNAESLQPSKWTVESHRSVSRTHAGGRNCWYLSVKEINPQRSMKKLTKVILNKNVMKMSQ